MRPEPVVSFSIANINPGTVRSEFMVAMMATIQQERVNAGTDDTLPVQFDMFYSHFCGPYLDDGRNFCALWFLNETESDYLVFIDSDVVPKPSDPFTLVHTAHTHGVTLLSGVYYNQFNNHGGLRALVHEWGPSPTYRDEDGTPLRDLIPLPQVALNAMYPQTKPHPIDACGFGMVAVHRSCLVDMKARYAEPQPFFAELVLDGIHMGEDLTFCVRAAALDHRPHVLPSIEVDHYKVCNVRSENRRVI